MKMTTHVKAHICTQKAKPYKTRIVPGIEE